METELTQALVLAPTATPLHKPVRVHTLARMFGVTSQTMRAALRRYGIYTKSASSPVEPVAAAAFITVYRPSTLEKSASYGKQES
jgi:hypothetical protein